MDDVHFDFDGARDFLLKEALQVVIASRAALGWRTRRLEVVGPLGEDLRSVAVRALDLIAKRRGRAYVEGWAPDPGTYSGAPADVADGPLVQLLLDAYSAPVEPDLAPADETTPEPDGAIDESLKGRVLGLVARNQQKSLLIVRAQNL